MNLNMNKVLFCGCLATLMVFLASSFSLAGEEDVTGSLIDVDEIGVDAHVDRGQLIVRMTYRKSEQGRVVYWDGGAVQCSCRVYENEGQPGKQQIRHFITHGRRTVNTDMERIDIDIPEQYIGPDKIGSIDCSFDTGYRHLQATDDFLLHPLF